LHYFRRRFFLGHSFRATVLAALLLAPQLGLAAENAPKVSLETSETLFSILTAINTCGYDAELNASDPLRLQIRAEVAKATEAFDQAKEETTVLCQFYQEHVQADPSRTLSQYVSLALLLDAPPGFSLKVKEADLPPDALLVAGIVPILQKFYDVAGLHTIWLRHQDAYSSLPARYHDPLSKVLFDTEIYLKLPSAGFLGRSFTVYVDAMGAPGQTNARNYGTDYYVVISSSGASTLKTEQIRHTYLHYLLDPLAMKYPQTVAALAPLLDQVKKAPMDEGFKSDVSLLLTESFIRAIEARTNLPSKTAEAQRQQAVQSAVEQGYILTPYFYETLLQFEKSPTGLRNAYGEIVRNIDLHKEQKRAAQVQFASKADPELLHQSRPVQAKLLAAAEQRLSAGDAEGARKLAQEALDTKSGDPGRALFILAQVATMSRDMQGARQYFEQALGLAHEPKVVAWSHIYLGRIFDLQEEREAALDHYRAALSASASLPEAKAAAERGLQQPYEPPGHPQETKN
jgi:tetratricopeptide (TPR) repeat protein